MATYTENRLTTLDQVKDLAGVTEAPCVSIYLSTHRKGQETQQDPIRLKNLLREVEPELVERGLRSTEAAAFLTQARDLIDDRDLWNHQLEGMAVFVSPGLFEYYRLPIAVEDRASVDTSFHILPLIPAVAPDFDFHVLNLDQNNIRLLRGNRHSIGEVDLLDAPTSLKEFLADTEFIRSLQSHAGSSGGSPGGHAALFHGQGIQDEKNDKKRLLHFFQKLDAALHEFVDGANTPLVLAGLPHLQSLFREAHGAKTNLIETGVDKNPADLTDEEMHETVWAIVSQSAKDAEAAARDRFAEVRNKSPEKAPTRLEDTVPPAIYQLIDTLFVPVDGIQWGEFKEDEQRLARVSGPGMDATELFNLCASKTLQFGGTVYPMNAEDLPGQAEIAAIVR